MTDLYAVIGNPIQHSKSPIIHRAFAMQTGQDMDYQAVLAPLDGFDACVHALMSAGFLGANVTVPFKLQAYQLAQRVTERAQDAGAVNTLIFQGNDIIGDNTDGIGLVRDITQNLAITLQGKRILLIGAGGASEGVLHPLLATQPSLLIITNRSMDKAINMVKKVEAIESLMYVSVDAYAFDELAEHQFDVVINATSVGLQDQILPLPANIFASNALAYDMMYGKQTAFMQFARTHGAQVSDGLGMLVEQAAEAFYLWRGVRPNTAPVMQMLANL